MQTCQQRLGQALKQRHDAQVRSERARPVALVHHLREGLLCAVQRLEGSRFHADQGQCRLCLDRNQRGLIGERAAFTEPLAGLQCTHVFEAFGVGFGAVLISQTLQHDPKTTGVFALRHKRRAGRAGVVLDAAHQGGDGRVLRQRREDLDTIQATTLELVAR